MTILPLIEQGASSGKKLLAVLLDPENHYKDPMKETLEHCQEAGVDIIMIGGSLITHTQLDDYVRMVREYTSLPVLLFPGDVTHISSLADSILFLSLISGRNPEMLIGRHVLAAPLLKNSGLEVIPTGYMLVGDYPATTVQYMSNTFPIPYHKDDIAACTAMAGEMLGLKLIYMDAGSGAGNHISENMVRKVKEQISIPLVVGGGIRSAETAYKLVTAGADMIVVGNILETNNRLIGSLAKAVHSR